VTTFVPRTAAEVADAVRWAMAEGEALEIIAGGTRSALGRPVDAPHMLDVSGLKGVLSYEPEELVLTARPGTPLAEIETLLASRKQHLAFEPPSIGGLREKAVGTGQGTLGGVVATGLSGPRRPRAGAVRDHVLGIAAVSGRGEAFIGGGKVVKNVTGYDIPKLMTGSYGTLAVLTEITIKVLPAPEETRTLLVLGMNCSQAVRTMTEVLQTAVDASGACHLPQDLQIEGKPDGVSATAFRLEGVRPSVEFRLAKLRDRLAAAGSHVMLEGEASLAFWRGVRDVTPLSADANRTLWRLSVPPAQGAEVVARIEKRIPKVRAMLDWGGGLIWLQPAASADVSSSLACEEKIRGALSAGHAMLVRAPADVRRTVNVFHPQPAALAALSNRVDLQFDPKLVLNPGRMYSGV
jgi:glycolate oxidase FAD binding subunit